MKENKAAYESVLNTEISDSLTEELTDRLKENYRLAALEDYDGALKAVDLDEIKADISLNAAQSEGMIENLENNARELYTRIETLEKKGLTPQSIEEIHEIYAIILDLFETYGVGFPYLFVYSQFLGLQNDYPEAIRVAELFEHCCLDPKFEMPDAVMANVYNLLGMLYSDSNQLDKSEKSYLQALEVLQEQTKMNPGFFESDLAMVLNNLGTLYAQTGRMEEAETKFLQALEIRKRQAKDNPEEFGSVLAASLNNLGDVYMKMQKLKEAEELLLEALNIQRCIYKKDPASIEADFASTFNNLGSLYMRLEQFEDCESMYFQAAALWQRLTDNNPAAYEVSLVQTLSNLGLLYYEFDDLRKAEETYLITSKIWEKLAKENPAAYEPDWVKNLCRLGDVCFDIYKTRKAENVYMQALQIMQKLAAENPAVYTEDLANLFKNLGSKYFRHGISKSAESGFMNAIDCYRTLLKDPGSFENVDTDSIEFELADTYNLLGTLQMKTNKLQDADASYLQALAAYKSLAQKDPEYFGPYVGLTLIHLSNVYEKAENKGEAAKYTKQAIKVLEELGIPVDLWLDDE